MRKSIIILATMAFAAVFFTGCNQEENFENTPIDKSSDVIGFQMPTTNTRAEVSLGEPTGLTIELSRDEDGNCFSLEESIQYLDNTMVTRGTPAYTENVGALYGSFNAVLMNGSNAVQFADGAFTHEDGVWTRRFKGQDPWDKADPLYFYMRMPASMDSNMTGDYTYALANGKQTITFTYTSPTDAASQADILFAARSLTKAQYEEYLSQDTYPDVLFNHALTGVKFAIGNDAEEITAKTISITNVTFKNINSKGTCVITPASENSYKDQTATYSSATAAVWTLTDDVAEISSGTYTGTVDFAAGGNFGENKPYPASFSNAGNTANLNKADGSQTFWLIPQVVSDDVVLTISYKYDGKEYSGDLDFGKVIKMKTGNNITWKAGELRTYTIRVDEVNVKIEDVVTMAEKTSQTISTPWGDKEADSWEGSTKTGVTITNTGNTKAFIRAAIIGQWLNADGDPVFGFTDYTYGVQLVDSWYQDQFVNNTFVHGKFTGLPGYDGAAATLNNWTKGNDGYYYYNNAVEAGASIPDALFSEYKVGEAPAAAVAGAVQNIYFQLEIATQAISAMKLDGTEYSSYSDAWANAKAQQ